MKDLKVWTRLGDQGDYEDYDTPYDAGIKIGEVYSILEPFEDEVKPRYRGKGYELPGFEGNNYISLFWGDYDAQDSVELNESDKLDFESGLTEGLTD